jgi:hypothetical protein
VPRKIVTLSILFLVGKYSKLVSSSFDCNRILSIYYNFMTADKPLCDCCSWFELILKNREREKNMYKCCEYFHLLHSFYNVWLLFLLSWAFQPWNYHTTHRHVLSMWIQKYEVAKRLLLAHFFILRFQNEWSVYKYKLNMHVLLEFRSYFCYCCCNMMVQKIKKIISCLGEAVQSTQINIMK